jgi:K+-sensing histidine kinase KdpD
MNAKDQLPAGDTVDVTDFVLSNLSHELRTPLSAILLWTKVLSEQLKPSKQQLLEGLQAIRECAEEQDAMIEDMVDDSRVAVGRIELRPERVGLREQIKQAIARCKAESAAGGLVIEERLAATLGEVLLDPRRFQQVIVSLIDNAARRSSDGGTIVISADRKKESLEIAVEDSGDGFSADALLHVFDRFPAEIAEWKGKANPLYTASRLAFLLHGSLVAKNGDQERGAIFMFTLAAPIIAAPSEERAKDKRNTHDFDEEKQAMPRFDHFQQNQNKNGMLRNQNLGLA